MPKTGSEPRLTNWTHSDIMDYVRMNGFIYPVASVKLATLLELVDKGLLIERGGGNLRRFELSESEKNNAKDISRR